MTQINFGKKKQREATPSVCFSFIHKVDNFYIMICIFIEIRITLKKMVNIIVSIITRKSINFKLGDERSSMPTKSLYRILTVVVVVWGIVSTVDSQEESKRLAMQIDFLKQKLISNCR